MGGEQEKINEIIEYYRNQRDFKNQENIVLMLKEIQEEFGCIPMYVQDIIAERFDIKTSVIGLIIKLYPSLRQGIYEHEIVMCSGQRCAQKGGADIIRLVNKTLGVSKEGVSENGKIFVRTINCLKNCRTSPNIIVDGVLYSKLSQDDLKRLLESLL